MVRKLWFDGLYIKFALRPNQTHPLYVLYFATGPPSRWITLAKTHILLHFRQLF